MDLQAMGFQAEQWLFLLPGDREGWWLGVGALALVAWLWISYRVVRRILGHRKWRGAWYSEKQFGELVQILYEDQRRGNRVMRHDEIALIRGWQRGTPAGVGSDKGNGYFLQ